VLGKFVLMPWIAILLMWLYSRAMSPFLIMPGWFTADDLSKLVMMELIGG